MKTTRSKVIFRSFLSPRYSGHAIIIGSHSDFLLVSPLGIKKGTAEAVPEFSEVGSG